MYLRNIVTLLATLGLLPAYEAVAQVPRVPVPNTSVAQGSTYSAPPSTFAPPAMYGGGSTYAPGATYAAPPTYVPPVPTFDPYAPGTVAQPPAAVPYSYAPPAQAPPTSPWQSYPGGGAAPTYPQQQPTSIYPGGVQNPLGWQQGSWGFGGQEGGYMVTAQRLLQELGVEHTWLYGDHDVDDLEIHRAEIYSTFAFPMAYTLDSPLLITPGFAANFLEGPIGDPAPMMGPRGPDLPAQIYDAYLDVAWYPQFNQLIGGELGVRTGIWSDFDHLTDDSIRFLGRGLLKVSVTPQMDILVGVVYLDRVKTKLLPAGGVYWRPTPEWDAYIVFPNPKARKHFSSVGNTEWYFYFAGEYGGGSWTVDRVGTSDRIDINDIRASFGFEFETLAQTRGHIEVGYVFDREVIFADTGTPAEFKPDDTFMVRGGVDF